MTNQRTLIVGAGIYGVTAALELVERGHQVTILERGTINDPLAASTDISKVVRMEYGADREYMEMVALCIERWHRWNHELPEPLYHETGVTMITRGEMSPGEFEYESYHNLVALGHEPERLDARAIHARFPSWNSERYVDGFYHARAGYAESGKVVAALAKRATASGARIHERCRVARLLTDEGRVRGLELESGEEFTADYVVVCAGTWTQTLMPELQAQMKSTGHPVFHLEPKRPEHFTPDRFVVFTADIARTGWYGFPLIDGVVKIANHGGGFELHPDNDPREVTAQEEQRLRVFLEESIPELAKAPIVFTRRCLYADTLDEHLWIDRHPEIGGLVVAAGGSGHAFKLAPLLGELIADALEGSGHRFLPKFRWRDLSDDTIGREEARFHH